MGLKIMGKEFIYPGTTRLLFAENGLIKEHRDILIFVDQLWTSPSSRSFIRWLYKKFVS